jgi:hypothetical protein
MSKTKPTQDIDASLTRFLAAARRIRAGIEHQQSRILGQEQCLPKLLEGTEYEVRDFTNSFANDIDYYIYELGRLLDLVQDEACLVFSIPNENRVNVSEPERVPPPELAGALEAFLLAVPMLKETRNALTHFDDSVRLDNFGSFSAAVNFLPDGSVQYLVDPRYQHHEAALALNDALVSFLRNKLTERIAADPPKPLLEQIRLRAESSAAATGGSECIGDLGEAES